jgi:hypothetical protein
MCVNGGLASACGNDGGFCFTCPQPGGCLLKGGNGPRCLYNSQCGCYEQTGNNRVDAANGSCESLCGSSARCSDVDGGVCEGIQVSRRAFKKDISYVDEAEREELASEALAIPLARYRYKDEPEDQKKHLGFIIDDQCEASPAVASDGTHVDPYGYTSMLLATVQEQQRQIDELKKQLAELKRREQRPTGRVDSGL